MPLLGYGEYHVTCSSNIQPHWCHKATRQDHRTLQTLQVMLQWDYTPHKVTLGGIPNSCQGIQSFLAFSIQWSDGLLSSTGIVQYCRYDYINILPFLVILAVLYCFKLIQSFTLEICLWPISGNEWHKGHSVIHMHVHVLKN